MKTKTTLAVSVAILIIAVTSLTVLSQNTTKTSTDNLLARVACMGDSITQITDYPADLQNLLGNISNVQNFGATGSTVNLYTDQPYYFEPAFHHAKAFLPTTVIIMLGTNDVHANAYQQVSSFIASYGRLIRSIQAVKSDPQIFLVEPPPIYNNTLGLDGANFTQGIIPRIQQVANQFNLPLIDVYTPMLNHPEYFSDGVHPNNIGAQVIANIIYQALEADSK